MSKDDPVIASEAKQSRATHFRHSGAMRSIEPGISKSGFAAAATTRNDGNTQ